MKNTDWDSYYQKPYKTASFTRKLTQNALLNTIKKYSKKKQNLEICELGGGNSCFFDALVEDLYPSKYTIIDNNELGLKKFTECQKITSISRLFNDNVLELKHKGKYDIVFSVGLIEHFKNKDVITAIKSHFKIVKNEGIVIISVPTPTFSYRLIRKISEFFDLWIFYDETPIKINEVSRIVSQFGIVLDYKILWGLGLTQVMFTLKKK